MQRQPRELILRTRMFNLIGLCFGSVVMLLCSSCVSGTLHDFQSSASFQDSQGPGLPFICHDRYLPFLCPRSPSAALFLVQGEFQSLEKRIPFEVTVS